MVTTLLNAKELKEKTLRALEVQFDNEFKLLVDMINSLASKGRFHCVVADFDSFTPHGIVDSRAINVMDIETYCGYLKKCGYNISSYSITNPMDQKVHYYVISWKDV